MKKLFVLIAFSFIVFPLVSQKLNAVLQEDTVQRGEIKYSNIQFENDDDYSTFSIIDSSIMKYKYFFVGENHQFRYTNSKMELKFLKYLYNKVGVRTLVLEFGYARGYLINKYINNEKDSNLYQVLSNYSYQEYADFYKDIRDFNLKQPENQRIHVMGIDVERFEDLPAKLLTIITPDKEIPDSLSLSIESLIGLTAYLDKYHLNQKERLSRENTSLKVNRTFFLEADYNTIATLTAIIEDVDRKDSLYKAFYGENSIIFFKVIQEIKDMIKYRDYYEQTQQYVYREQYMFTKLKTFIDENPNEKIFGQFGRCHVSTTFQDEACDWFKYYSIASRINKYSKTKGLVFSVGVFYPKDEQSSDFYEGFPNLESTLEKSIKDSISIIPTNGDTSLFDSFAKSYNYVIVNNGSLQTEKENFVEDDNPYRLDSYEKKSKFHLYYSFVQRKYNLDNLNSAYTKLNYRKFNSNINVNRFGYYTQARNKSTQGVYFDYTSFGKNQNTNDSSTAKMFSFNIEFNYGYDFIKSDLITLKPSIGFGVNTFHISIIQDSEKVMKEKNILGDDSYWNYTNSAFVLIPSFEALIHYSNFSIGGTVGYNFDMSNKAWTNDNNVRIGSEFNTSLSNLYYGFIATLYF